MRPASSRWRSGAASRAIEPASLSVGTQTETAARRARSAREKSVRSKERPRFQSVWWTLMRGSAAHGPGRVVSTMAVSEPGSGTSYPWEAVLETGSRRRTRGDLARTRAVRAGRAHARVPASRPARGIVRGRESRRSGPTRPRRLQAARRGHAIVTTGTASGKSLAFNLPVLDTLAERSLGTRASTSIRPRRSPRTRRARSRASAGATCATPSTTATRRARSAAPIRAALEPAAHQPGHAARGRAAQPPLLGRRARQPRLGRGRRGPRLPRRVRLARGQRAAPPAPARARLRGRAALRARERDDRQPARAGGAPDRARAQLVDRDGAPRAERQIAMWNPPLVDEKLGRRASSLSEAATCSPSLVEREVRTICFLNSRRGVELIQRFARARLEDAGRSRPGRAHRALPRRLYADAATRDRAAPVRGRPARRGGHQRARARHRRRRARRRPVRDLPGHGGEPAPDVGARGPPRTPGSRCTSPARTRSTSSSAATPTSSSSGRSSRRSSTTSPRRSTSPTSAAAAYELPLTPEDADDLRPALGGARPAAGQAGPPARARRALHAARRGLPGGSDRPALGLARTPWPSSRRAAAR